jgi:hypothetical protein
MNKNSIRARGYIIELINPPIKHDIERTNLLFSQLKDYYTSCERPADNVTNLIKNYPNTGEIKKLSILPDRIILINDFTQGSLESFIENANDILNKTIITLKIPLFFFRQYTIRMLANPLNVQDSRVFICEKVCQFEDISLKKFGRAIHGCGLKFVFPPTPSENNEFSVRIESLLRNVKEIFVENQARFLNPLPTNDDKYLEVIAGEIKKTQAFIIDNISEFLTQYNK